MTVTESPPGARAHRFVGKKRRSVEDRRFVLGQGRYAADVTLPQKALLTDAQTSGGLLLSVPQRNLQAALKCLKRYHAPCATVIGRIVRSNKPIIGVAA